MNLSALFAGLLMLFNIQLLSVILMEAPSRLLTALQSKVSELFFNMWLNVAWNSSTEQLIMWLLRNVLLLLKNSCSL